MIQEGVMMRRYIFAKIYQLFIQRYFDDLYLLKNAKPPLAFGDFEFDNIFIRFSSLYIDVLSIFFGKCQ